MSETFQFAGFTLREATLERDYELAKDWNYADPDHRDTTLGTFWLQQGEETNSYLLEDESGPVFFFRMDARERFTWMEVHIQFAPGNALLQARTRRGIRRGFAWLEKMLTESGFEGYYFHSRSPQLIFFCQNRLGFEWDGTKIYRKIKRG
jgi:hypothetical protein